MKENGNGRKNQPFDNWSMHNNYRNYQDNNQEKADLLISEKWHEK